MRHSDWLLPLVRSALPEARQVPGFSAAYVTAFLSCRLWWPNPRYGIAEEHELYGRGKSCSLTTLYPDIRREHHPPAPRAYELPSHLRSRRLPRPSLRRPRTRFLPRATRRHSPNPHLRRWTVPANLPIAGPKAFPVPPGRMPPYPRSGFSPEPVS